MDVGEIRRRNVAALVAGVGGPTEFGRRIERDQAQVSQWLSPTHPKPIGGRLARHIEACVGRHNGWLDTPQWRAVQNDLAPVAPSATRPDYVRFPLLEGFAGMGRGDYVGDYPEIVDWVEVTREWAVQKLRGVPLGAIRVITGRGDSMAGTYADGDLIFLDSRIKRFQADGAYCYRWGGQVQVKRLQQVGDGKLRILSANAAYPPIDVDMADVEIGARALAAWTLTGF